MASRGCGANRNAGGPDPDRQAFMAWRGQSLPAPVSHCRKRQRGSAAESATVERREGSRSPRKVRALQARGRASQARQKEKSAPVGAPSTPHRGDGIAAVATAAGAKAPWARRRTRKRRHLRRDAQTRAQQRAAGTNNTALFDIVNTTTANGSLRARRCRTVVRVDSRGAPDANRSPQRERGFSHGAALDFAARNIGRRAPSRPRLMESCRNAVAQPRRSIRQSVCRCFARPAVRQSRRPLPSRRADPRRSTLGLAQMDLLPPRLQGTAPRRLGQGLHRAVLPR